MQKIKYYLCRCTAESGRTMVETLAVLSLVGVLSVGGLWFYTSSNREREIDDIIYHMNIQVAQIYPAMEMSGKFESKESLNKFLEPYNTKVGNYTLNFQADPNSDGNDFLMQITNANGEPIKGGMCRKLVHKMSKLKMAQDISFSLKDEEMEDGSVQDVLVPLNGRTVDYNAMCGD